MNKDLLFSETLKVKEEVLAGEHNIVERPDGTKEY